MLRLRLTVFLMVLSALGCAGSQPVRMQLPPGARIGILNVLEPQMTHVNVGSLRYDSFTKGYIIVAVFQPRPAILAAYGWAPCSKSSLPDFPWKSDLQFLGPAVIQQVRPDVEHLGAEAARTALANAGLLL
jgi:hypothetical protein